MKQQTGVIRSRQRPGDDQVIAYGNPQAFGVPVWRASRTPGRDTVRLRVRQPRVFQKQMVGLDELEVFLDLEDLDLLVRRLRELAEELEA